MKTLVAIALLFFISTQFSSALEFSLVGKSNATIWQSKELLKLPMSVSEISVILLNQAKTTNAIKTFAADESGILYINNLGSDIQIINDKEFNFYKWCFSINGFASETLPAETIIGEQNTKITWYYAYDILITGERVKTCLPAN